MQTAQLSEQELVRREKLEELKKLGIEPYPAPLYPVNNHSTEIKASFRDDEKDALADRISCWPPALLYPFPVSWFLP